VVTTVITGLAGIWIVIELIRGSDNAYRNALILLVVGTLLGGIQFYASQQLFGKAAPANMKFYFNLLTLILFLVFLIPGLNQLVNFSRSGSDTGMDSSGGLAAIAMGALLLLTPSWAGPSHTIQGENWVDLLETELSLGGGFLLFAGIFILLRSFITKKGQGSLPVSVQVSLDK
jgi:hypothetical protein